MQNYFFATPEGIEFFLNASRTLKSEKKKQGSASTLKHFCFIQKKERWQ
jgi:hypothetical protein